MHCLLRGTVGGAAEAAQWPHCEHAGRPRHLCGGNPTSRLLPAYQVHIEERGGGGGKEMSGGRMDG